MRWVNIFATSPSGKAQFICRYCGRTSVTPDKECPKPPFRPASIGGPDRPCHELEILDSAHHPALSPQLLSLPELMVDVQRLYRRKASAQIRKLLTDQRVALIQVVKHLAFTAMREDKRLQWAVWDKLDALREELQDGR